MRQQFTQKERDTETGLDYFGARYYSTTQGRFTTVDPLMASASTSTPQSFNRYSYVRNNPLNSIDPNGMDDCVIGKTCSFTTNDWATSGNHPEQGLIQETVTVPIPQVQPIPLETTDVSIIETVTLTSAQVASDTVIGAGKYAYNTLYGTANLFNAPIDYGLSFFTDFQFGQAELSQASTPGEQSAMYGMTIGGLMIGGYSLFGGTTSAATAANTSNAANQVRSGMQVFRVFGDDASAFGRASGGSFTSVNPATVSNYRAAAGLPQGNTGRFVLEGMLNDTRGVTFRSALPGPGGAGGLPELVIPNAAHKVTVTRVSGVNPPF